ALGLTAVDGVDVHGRLTRALGHHGHIGVAGGHGGIELALELFHHRAHVADGRVAQEGHGAVGDTALGLDLGPPDAAGADADPIHVQRLGDDDVVDLWFGEPAALGQIGDAAVSAGFLVHRAGYFERAGQGQAGIDQGLDRDDGGGQPALHVAGAPAIDAAVLHLAAEGIDGPARPDLDHVDMAVEVDARTGFGAGPAGDDIGPRIFVAVARRAFAAHIFDGEAALLQPLADVFGAGA